MLRDETEVALNDLIGLTEAAAQAYERAAKALEGEEVRDTCAALARQRLGMANDIRAHDRRLGDIPHAPDPDLSTARDVFAHLKAALASDHHLALLEDCEAADSQLVERLADALDLSPLPEATATLLRQMRFDVVAAVGRVAAVKARL